MNIRFKVDHIGACDRCGTEDTPVESWEGSGHEFFCRGCLPELVRERIWPEYEREAAADMDHPEFDRR